MRPTGTRRYLAIAVMALLATILVAACSPGPGGTAASSPAGAAPSQAAASAAPGAPGAVAIKDFAFSPASITVAAGTTVTWTNQDSASHTVAADDGSFDSKEFGNGASFSQTFSTAGTYSYHCAIHSSMTGTVEVK
jgi:plastocyanin